MRLRWLTVLLAGAFAAGLSVVVLRAETARVHYELARLVRQAEMLRQELRAAELEFARRRHPALIRARLAELRVPGVSGQRSIGAGPSRAGR